MSDFPPISGWPTDYPLPDPKYYAQLVYDDLSEVKKDTQLVASASWISKFTKNAHKLDKILDQVQQMKHIPKVLLDIHNWFHNAEEDGNTLSDVLFYASEENFQKLQPVKEFVQSLIEKDPRGMVVLLHYFQEYLK